MDNVGIVVDDLEAAIAFFLELGLELEGEATVEGRWVDRTVGLDGVQCDIAMLRTPDGHSRLELSKFHAPPVIRRTPEPAPVNALGYLRVMFAVDDIEGVLARLQARGAELVGEVVQYEDSYRLCYVRGPEGIMVGLAEQLVNQADGERLDPRAEAFHGMSHTGLPSAGFVGDRCASENAGEGGTIGPFQSQPMWWALEDLNL